MSNKKSFLAKIEEIILMQTKPDYMDSYEKVNDLIKERLNAQEKPPKSALFKSTYLNGTQIFHYGNSQSKNLIVYIHGGAFINEIGFQHHFFCSYISKKLDAYVISPVYPLAPKHSCNETFNQITDLYKSLIEENKSNGDNKNNNYNNSNNNKSIYLMGDSAGGGFVLSFCQYLKTVNLPQPDKIVVYSPWVDISMDDSPYDNESDPILGEIGLREIGKSWAGELDTKDYRVSPLFGDNSGLAPILIFAGDNEIFYKDILKYYEKLKEDNVDARLVVGSGMFHIYPLFPSPEASEAFKELKKEFE
ncbi:hydrolase alpha/beta fold family [Methanobrevibacter ruminantium M1]|uniref:Hydrolase alpha/beta fold family n=1 Tax=Methanobrevibacter ruminantium (strain ATCC 35063 / DSM 1093 / JCM 13430 / OCM 146 / M1) TaxID=634498 RepID=D3E179_METRM|nr:alpha/beta hydrolase fold domain-containing protein [Methanobrevibacter ruminantium]ADC46362.1 hydrolase alpha/beta fold family [Methanobrevibacter ruminantium M1]